MRLLAREAGINVNTAAKAYAELDRSGVISTAPGRGSFVASRALMRLVDFREDRLRDLLGRAVGEALSLGYSFEQIEGALALQWARWRELRSAGSETASMAEAESAGPRLRIAGSHDLALDLLIGQLRRLRPDLKVISSNVGSLAGLIALERGEADVAGCHLLDEETGEYNSPFLRRILPGEEAVLVNLVHRQQGLMVARGNPKGICSLSDLARPDVTVVNRQRGAGTRVLLDLRLRQLRISPGQLRGYDHELQTHTAVAAAVAGGPADAGLGILSAAKALGLDFIPIARERYDLALRATSLEHHETAALLGVLRAESFKLTVKELGGYDTTDTGRVVGRTG